MQTKTDNQTMRQRYTAAHLFRVWLCGWLFVALPLSVSAQSVEHKRLYGVHGAAVVRPFSSASPSVGTSSFASTTPSWFGQDVSSPTVKYAVNYAAGYNNGWKASGQVSVSSPLVVRKKVHVVRSMGGGVSSGSGMLSSGVSSGSFSAPRAVSVRSVLPLSGVSLSGGVAVPLLTNDEAGGDDGTNGDDNNWLPANPEEDYDVLTKNTWQTTTNGTPTPVGDALFPLLCGALLFLLYRRKKGLHISRS